MIQTYINWEKRQIQWWKKKLLGIVVLGLVLSGNAFAEKPNNFLTIKNFNYSNKPSGAGSNGCCFDFIYGFELTNNTLDKRFKVSSTYNLLDKQKLVISSALSTKKISIGPGDTKNYSNKLIRFEYSDWEDVAYIQIYMTKYTGDGPDESLSNILLYQVSDGNIIITDKSKKDTKLLSKSIKVYTDLIKLFPSNIDALEERKLNELRDNILSIDEVQIFGMDDSKYVDSNYIFIVSDPSVKMWQLTCKLYGDEATSFLQLAKGKSVVIVKLTGTVVGYRRTTGMYLDHCKVD